MPRGYANVGDLPAFYEAPGSDPTNLVQTILSNLSRKRLLQQQDERLRMAEEERLRNNAIQDEDRALKVAELQQRIAAMTSEASLPTTPKEVTEGAFVNPDEAEYAGVTPGFKPTGSTTTQVPTAPRATSVTVGGQKLDIPLRYKEQVEAEAESASDKALELEQRRKMLYLPGVGMVHEKLVDFFKPRAERPVAVTIDGIETLATPSEIEDAKKAGSKVEPYVKPAATPTKPQGSYVTNEKGQRVWVSAEDQASAPPGTYSDIRPPSARVVKADPAKLKMAISALGDATTPNSLWALAVEINQDKGMLAALKGVGKRKLTEMSPEMASQSTDPQLVKINMYNTALQGFASSIAKAFGESGVLTNQDIARATGLFPKPGESPSTTIQKLQRVKSVMEAGMQDPAAFREIFGRDPKPAGGGAAGDGTPESPIDLTNMP